MAKKDLYNVDLKKTSKSPSITDQPSRGLNPFMREKDDTLGFLNWQLQETLGSRPLEETWSERWEQYNAKTYWNQDGTANINRPIEKSVIRNKMADELSVRPSIELLPQEQDDIYKADLMRILWDYVWVEADTDKELYDTFLCKNVLGTAFWFEGVYQEIHTRYIPKQTDDGKIEGEAMVEKKSWLKGWTLDPRDVFVEPVESIDKAEWCFIREREVSYDKLDNLRHDPNFKNIDEALESPGDQSLPYEYVTDTEADKGSDRYMNKYTLWHYYNKAVGRYYVAVGDIEGNLQIIIRDSIYPFMHGELPISPIVDHKKFKEIYGYGECELLETSKYEINMLENQIIDAARASSTKNLAIGENAAFEDSELIDGVMRVWHFSGDLSNAQYLQAPPTGPELNNAREMLMDNVTIDTGIDTRALLGSPTKTAFEAKLQEQTKLKGVNMSLKQADFFYQRVFRQRLANIQQFMPKTTGKKILGNSDYRTVALEGVSTEEQIVGSIGDDNRELKGIKINEAPSETSFLELKPEYIKNNFDIKVETPSTSPILRELEKDTQREVIQENLQLASADPTGEAMKAFKFRELIEDNFKREGFDPGKVMTVTSKMANKQDIRQRALQNIPLPPQPKGQPVRQAPMQTPPGYQFNNVTPQAWATSADQ